MLCHCSLPCDRVVTHKVATSVPAVIGGHQGGRGVRYVAGARVDRGLVYDC
jgi:hypothetical protein